MAIYYEITCTSKLCVSARVVVASGSKIASSGRARFSPNSNRLASYQQEKVANINKLNLNVI
jgi:hypothetical protein